MSADGHEELQPNIPYTMGKHPCITAIPGNKLLITGGLWGYQTKTLTYIYDFDANAWSSGPDLVQSRQGHGCANLTLANGTSVVVVAAGASTHSRET